MDLSTGKMVRRPHVLKCVMTKLVINQVERMVEKQGFKVLKFFNRRGVE